MTSFDAFTIELGHLTVNRVFEGIKKCLENVIKLLIFESKNFSIMYVVCITYNTKLKSKEYTGSKLFEG